MTVIRRAADPNIAKFTARLGAAALCASLIVGCSARETGTLPAKYQMSSDAESVRYSSSTLPAVAVDSGNHSILLLDAKYKHIGSIDAPNGYLAMDAAGDIYDGSSNMYHDWLRIYKPPYTTKPTEISFESVGVLSGVAVDNKTGVFAAAILPSDPEYDGSISFFRRGQTTPCSSVSVPIGGGYFNGTPAFDASGVLYFNLVVTNGYTIASVAGECTPKGLETYTPTLNSAQALQFNNNNELLVDEGTLNQGLVVTYAHPSNGNLGKALYTTHLKEMSGEGPILCSLTSDTHQLWAVPIFKNGLGLFNYPAGGAPVRVLNFGKAGAVAVNPPIIP